MSSEAGMTAAEVGDGEEIAAPGHEKLRAAFDAFDAFPQYAAPVFKW